MSESQPSQPDLNEPVAAEQQPADEPQQSPVAVEANRHHGAIFQTGELTFSILTKEGPVDRAVDLLWLKLTCEEAEKEHALQQDAEGRQQPTPAFLKDLANRLSEEVYGCTPTVAWQMWIAASHAMNELKNSMSGTPN